MDAELRLTQASIAAMGSIANGDSYLNTARPATSGVAECMRWPLSDNGGGAPAFASLSTAICIISGAHLNAAALATSDRYAPFSDAVIVAVARSALVTRMGLTPADINAAETVSSVPLTIHGDHEAAVRGELGRFASVAPRYWGVSAYNAVSMEVSNHNHLPSATGKLASTTIMVLGLREHFSATIGSETRVMHDMFHMLSPSIKSTMARSLDIKGALVDVGLSNVAKRIPVTQPDTGVTMGYRALHETAYGLSVGHVALPSGLTPPVSLHNLLEDYVDASSAQLPAIVGRMRKYAELLAPAAAILAAYCLERVRYQENDDDMSLKRAARHHSILGSPVLARSLQTFPQCREIGRQISLGRLVDRSFLGAAARAPTVEDSMASVVSRVAEAGRL